MDIRIHGRRLVMILELFDGLDVQQVFGAYLSLHPRVQEWEAADAIAAGSVRRTRRPASGGR
jgi:hypothetical protein